MWWPLMQPAFAGCIEKPVADDRARVVIGIAPALTLIRIAYLALSMRHGVRASSAGNRRSVSAATIPCRRRTGSRRARARRRPGNRSRYVTRLSSFPPAALRRGRLRRHLADPQSIIAERLLDPRAVPLTDQSHQYQQFGRARARVAALDIKQLSEGWIARRRGHLRIVPIHRRCDFAFSDSLIIWRHIAIDGFSRAGAGR